MAGWLEISILLHSKEFVSNGCSILGFLVLPYTKPKGHTSDPLPDDASVDRAVLGKVRRQILPSWHWCKLMWEWSGRTWVDTVHEHMPVLFWSENREWTVENFHFGCVKATSSIVGIHLSPQQYTYTYPQSWKSILWAAEISGSEAWYTSALKPKERYLLT